jgi:hypothetical protein
MADLVVFGPDECVGFQSLCRGRVLGGAGSLENT